MTRYEEMKQEEREFKNRVYARADLLKAWEAREKQDHKTERYYYKRFKERNVKFTADQMAEIKDFYERTH
jgi:hypothetical protein